MLNEIIAVVKECGAIVRNANIRHVELKNHDRRDLLTEYDLKIQAILQEKLIKILPEAAFFGEEGEHHCQREGYCFVCDPIDGTTNFVKDCHFSSISVALLKDGQPVLGVIYNPYLDELFSAEKGKGATLNGKPIHTTQETLSNSLVTIGTGMMDLSEIDQVFDYAKKCFRAAIDVRRNGSAALELCNLACGRIGYFCEFKLSPWDYSAGVLIVEEAGGIIKSKNFKDIDDYFQKRQIFGMANQKIADDVPPL